MRRPCIVALAVIATLVSGAAAPSFGARVRVDPGHSLTAALARAGDHATIVLAAGVWREPVVVDRPGVHLIGQGPARTRIDCTGLALARGKACIVVAAPGVVIEKLAIEGAVLPPERGANGACIRNEHGIDLTLRGISCAHSQDGLLTDGGRILIEDSKFFDNGWTGYTHNIYLSGPCEAVIRRTEMRGARIGHELKSRCATLVVEDPTIVVERGSRALDIPDGGMVTVRGGRIVQGATPDNADIVGFTPEACRHPGDLTMIGVSIETAYAGARIRNYDRCPGAAIRLEGVRIVAGAVALVGRVERIGPSPSGSAMDPSAP
jgi:hypothetical protein